MNRNISDRLQIKRAISIATDDSQSGGRYHRIPDPIQGQLLITVMGLNIDLLAVDYSEVASDKGRCTSGIIAILAKALSYAKMKCEFDHTAKYNVSDSKLRAWSGFSRLHRPFNEKTGLEYNQFSPCYNKRRSLPLTMRQIHVTNVERIFEITKKTGLEYYSFLPCCSISVVACLYLLIKIRHKGRKNF